VKTRRLVLLPVVLVLAAALAFLLRGVINDFIILPLAKVLFVIRGYYGSIAQSAYWPLILVVILIIGLSGLRIVDLNVHLGGERKIELHGDVYQMAFWLERLDRLNLFKDGFSQNPYPRWYVARTLADLAVDILNRRGVNDGRGGQLRGPGLAPPPDIQKYLEIALQANPATFSRMLEAASLTTVPEVEAVVQYIESFVENSK
jgi:hypothetical protein